MPGPRIVPRLGKRGVAIDPWAYPNKVLNDYGPYAYWPLWETAGGTAECLVNSPAQDGAYTGVTLANTMCDTGHVCPRFDGVGDYVDVLSAAFIAAFDADSGSLLFWVRAFDAAVWGGGNRCMIRLFADANNIITVYKSGANIAIRRRGGGVLDIAMWDAGNDVTWIPVVYTWEDGGPDRGLLYTDGIFRVQLLTIGTFVGNLTLALIGALTVGSEFWNGWLSDVALFDYVLTAPQAADISTV